jgi:hypothetical protein
MTWTPPRTWVTDEIPTAGIFNTHVRDNLRAVEPVAYAQRTTNVVGAAASENNPTLVLTTGSKTYRAEPILVEFSCALARNQGVVSLWDGAVGICRLCEFQYAVSPEGCALYGRVRITPSAGAHEYKAMSWSSTTYDLFGGDLGALSSFAPISLTISYFNV